MNRFSLSFVFTAVATFALAACTSDSNLVVSKPIDYKGAKPAQTLEIPPDLTAPRPDDRYAVPDTGGRRGAATYSDYSAERASEPAPGSTGVLTGSGGMRIDRTALFTGKMVEQERLADIRTPHYGHDEETGLGDLRQ